MTSPPAGRNAEPSGIDLARVALQQARAMAKTRPTSSRKPMRRALVRREDGREPARLGAALSYLVASNDWGAAVDGGTVMDRWPEIAPDLARTGAVRPVAYDPERQVLTLRPANHAYGTQLRLLGAQLITQINTVMGTRVVGELRVLPPGSRPIPGQALGAAPTTEPGHAPPRALVDGPSSGDRPATAASSTESTATPAFRLVRQRMAAELPTRQTEAAEPGSDRYFTGAYAREPETEVDEAALAAAEAARRAAEKRRAALLRARQDRAARAQAASIPTTRTRR